MMTNASLLKHTSIVFKGSVNYEMCRDMDTHEKGGSQEGNTVILHLSLTWVLWAREYTKRKRALISLSGQMPLKPEILTDKNSETNIRVSESREG